MDDATLSVVTPSLDQGVFIERTLHSVLDQGIDGLEYLVVDGGSRDDTLQILRRHESRLRWISEPDKGQADAVNKGLVRTRGEILGWLNSDDVYYPGALRAVREYLGRHPEVDVVYGNAHHIDEHDAILEPYYTEPWDPERLAEVCYLCQPAVFFRRRVVERCGLLDADLHFCLDYEYWLRLSRRGMRFAHLERYLAGSRLYATNKTLGQQLRFHREINGMLRRALGAVPDRWLSNWAHALLRQRGLTREARPLAFAVGVSALSWLAALRWNRRIRPSLWRTTRGWIGAAAREARERRRSGKRRRPPAKRPGRGGRLVIGYDVSQTGVVKAGCGVMADGLLRALVDVGAGHEYRLYPTFGDRYFNPGGAAATLRIERENVGVGPAQSSFESAREFWRGTTLEEDLGFPDIVHSHNFFCPTVLERTRLVYTVHDLAPLIHPEWTTEEGRQVCFEGLFDASLHADLIVAVSEATRQDFLANFPHYPRERVEVVHLASRFSGETPATPPASVDLEPDGFHLAVGTLEPRKNHLRLLRAFASHRARTEDPRPLVLAGGQGWLMEDLESQIEALEIGPHVRLTGYVDDGELQWLYRHCFAFYYPSLFEGFGLPPLEALSQGAAVVTSRIPSLLEVVGDAALLVDPTDGGEIGQAMARLFREPELRQNLRDRAPARAALFSWRKTAEAMLACYRRVLEMEKYAEPRDPRKALERVSRQAERPPGALLPGLEALRRELETVRADQRAKEELIQRLSSELEAVRADQQAKEELIQRLAPELEAVRADQRAKEELIRRLSAELAEVRADRRAEE